MGIIPSIWYRSIERKDDICMTFLLNFPLIKKSKQMLRVLLEKIIRGNFVNVEIPLSLAPSILASSQFRRV